MLLKTLLLLLIVALAKSNTTLSTNLGFPFDLPKGFGPWIRPTVGTIWPHPQLQQSSSDFMVLRPTIFQFEVKQKFCFDAEILDFQDNSL